MSLSIRRLGPALCLGLAASSVAFAAAPLGLAEALQRATTQNPMLVVQSHDESAADGLVEQAGQRPSPTLDVSLENFAGTGPFSGFDGVESTVQANQLIERGGKRAKRLGLAQAELDSAAGHYDLQRITVLAATATAYLETVAAHQRLELTTAPLRLAEETATAVDERVRLGDASPAEAARARVVLALARSEHRRAESVLVTARASLAAHWGSEEIDGFTVADAWRLPSELPSQTELLTKLAAHPRRRLQEISIDGRRAALELERARAVSDVTVSAGVRFFRENSDAAIVAGFSLPIPFSQQNQGNIRAARARLAGAEQTVAAVELELRVALSAAWQDLVSSRDTVNALRADALPATEEAHAIVREAYQHGQLPLIDVLDAQRALVAIHRELLDAETSFATALVRIDALTDTTFPLTNAILLSK